MTTITIYGGIGGIGGNKILLEDRDTKVWLDFGQSFGSGERYFTGFLQPRSSVGLRDYFEFDLLPKMPGLYSHEALKFTDLKYKEPEFDAIVASHPHSDHIAHLAFVDESVPVHISRVGKAVVDAWEKSSTQMDFGEHDYRSFDPGKKIKIGSIEIRPFEVDHSVLGACGFIIYTTSGPLVYTGDFRKHGPRASSTEKFLERAAEEKPVAMICEGTRVLPAEKQVYVGGEGDVRREAGKVLAGTDKIVVAAFYPRDVDRITTFAAIARDNGREFFVPTDTALLLTTLQKEGLDVPKLGKDYRVYVRRKKDGEFGESDYYKWERQFMKNAVNFGHVGKHQSKALIYLTFNRLTELVDIQPTPGGHFIHSRSEPLEEEPEAEVMPNWLDHFKLKFHQIHASGHCSKKEIEDVIRRIGPKRLFPIHSEHPELFLKFKGVWRVTLPELKKKYEI
jgi:ribonuclease J